MSPQDSRRLELLRSAPLNSWIALSEDEKIVATGATYSEVVERSEKAGVSDPFIIKTPDQWSPLSVECARKCLIRSIPSHLARRMHIFIAR